MLTMAFNALAVNPTSLKMKVYQISVAANEDCSSPITLFTSQAGEEKDMLLNPTLGSGNLDDGTYNCIMITMDDVIKFVPESTTGSCSGGTEYSIDLCRDQASSDGSALYSHTDLLEGTTFTTTECAGTDQSVSAGGISNKVTLFLRTTAPANNHADADFVSSWKKGTVTALSQNGGTGPSVDSASGIQLASPFVVAGSKTGVFYIDATGQIDGSNPTCDLQPPVFGFRDP